MFFSKEEIELKNEAENFLIDFFISNSCDDFSSFHGIEIDGVRVGSILQNGKGIVVIEAKPYYASQIKNVTEGGAIRFKDRPPEYAPINQAVQGMSSIIKAAKKNHINIDARFVTVAVAYPFITEEEFLSMGLNKTSAKELSFTKENFLNLNSFKKKLAELIGFVYGAVYLDIATDRIDDVILDKLGALYFSDYERIKAQGNQGKERSEVNLKVTSKKDLYYGICAFLMKNDITTGNIYSKSKELLDGLGDYMSSIKIPWYYKSFSNKSVGYCLIDGEAPIWEKAVSIVIDSENLNRIEVKARAGKRYCIDVEDHTIGLNVEEEVNFDAILHLKNEQIRKMFLRTFIIAEKEIDIISPWMNYGVVNERFEDLMRGALRRGVTIKIIYGLKPDMSDFNVSRSRRSDEVAKHLRELFSEYGNQLVIKRDNIHYKLVLCDEKYKLEGGYNYLSFVGDYSDKDTRKEGSPFGTNVDEIRLLREEYFKDVI